MWFKRKSTQEKEEFEIALLLLYSVNQIYIERKMYEAFHGGSLAGFEDNPFVDIKIQQFLTDKKINERLKELLKKTN